MSPNPIARSDIGIDDHSTMGTAPLSGEDIVCFSHTPWHGPWKASQQIMSLLAESNRVLYIGPPRAMRDAHNSFWARVKPLPVLERVRPALSIYHEPRGLTRIRNDRPLGWAYNRGTAWARFVHARYLAWRLGFHRPILWIFDPMQAHAAGRFGEKLLVYHVLDNYVEFVVPSAASLRAAIACGEKRMLKLADVVFTVSRPLYERCHKDNRQSFLVPNGVNYEHFQTTIASRIVPPDLQNIPRPIIGYVGAIQGDLDFPLLHRLAREVPDASIVFVGPEDLGNARRNFEPLLTYPNVHYLGAKAVEDVPHYISACDVCILPCNVENESATDSDQIKLYEYLACGRPVVATALPPAQRFASVIRIARNACEFVLQVKESLHEDPDFPEQRKRVASQHSWQRRVAALSEVIAQRIPSHSRKIGTHP